MTRIFLVGGLERVDLRFDRALEVLGAKVLAYDRNEHWLMVRKTEADAAVHVLMYHGIAAEIRTTPDST